MHQVCSDQKCKEGEKAMILRLSMVSLTLVFIVACENPNDVRATRTSAPRLTVVEVKCHLPLANKWVSEVRLSSEKDDVVEPHDPELIECGDDQVHLEVRVKAPVEQFDCPVTSLISHDDVLGTEVCVSCRHKLEMVGGMPPKKCEACGVVFQWVRYSKGVWSVSKADHVEPEETEETEETESPAANGE